MFHVGDIVEIPLPDSRIAIGWILHVSKHFKDAVGFIVLGIQGEANSEVTFDPDTGRPTLAKVLGPLYTNIDAIEHYGWRKFATQPISAQHLQLTKREVGGGVYVGDDYIGSVQDVGDPSIKPMQAMGMPVIYSEIAEGFS